MSDDLLKVDVDSTGTSEGIIALLQSTIKGLENLEGTFKLKLKRKCASTRNYLRKRQR